LTHRSILRIKNGSPPSSIFRQARGSGYHPIAAISDSNFTVRLCTVADASTVARHRVAMFRDMGQLPAALDGVEMRWSPGGEPPG